MSETSEDNELDDVGHDSMNFVGTMIRSRNAVDKRLISLFKLRQDEQMIDAEYKKSQTMTNKGLSESRSVAPHLNNQNMEMMVTQTALDDQAL